MNRPISPTRRRAGRGPISVRNKLSKSLEVLEKGLTLIEINHKLPTKAGAKGFVDILARDRLGKYVVIELKRSDQAAREAMHEILKYMRLFMEHHGVQAHRIRCFVVSTTWPRPSRCWYSSALRCRR